MVSGMDGNISSSPAFFATAAEFGVWLEKHSAFESELIVGFYKRDTDRASLTWPESVDEALCHGWIDGVRTRIDDQSYTIRFTPRKPTSTWSAINIARVLVLQSHGRVKEAGMEAYSHRREAKSKIYAYEQAENATLEREEEARFRRNKKAWKFFETQPPRYRHLVIWRIISAKRAETREGRLAKLIEASQNGQRL
jgi:uncharacterized protein YdeI (YjbR/CyaY-like superfamily)